MRNKILKIYKQSNLTEKLIYLYIFSIILPIVPRHFYSSISNKIISYSDLVFIFLLPTWIMYKLRQKFEIKHRRNYLIFFIFSLATLLSSVNSINLVHSLIDWLGLLYLITLFVIITDIMNTKKKFASLLVCYSLSSIIAAVVGLAAFICNFVMYSESLNPLLFSYPAERSLLFFPRIKYFFYTTNMFASFEHVGVVLIFSLFFFYRNRIKQKFIFNSLFLLSSVMVIVALFLAGSQTLAGAIISIFMILLLFKGKFFTNLKYITFLVAVLVTLFAFSATIWMLYPLEVDNNKSEKLISVQLNYAYSHHIIPSMYAFSMFKEHPILGVGIGNFGVQYPKYINMDIERLSSPRMEVKPDRILDPHNSYTGALAEWGVVGFLAMLAIFGYFIRMLIKKRSTSILANEMRWTLLAGFLGFIFNGIFADIIMMRHLWLFMAIIFIFVKLDLKIATERSSLEFHDIQKI